MPRGKLFCLRRNDLKQYLDCFPDVTREQVVVVLEYAHKLTLQPAA
jgi:hypothetical protein